ncbi:MAG: DUF2007 domain-containing protein [Planctomycetia bacterium]|nr:DUF2007 domain-containing protein [Planctomycetia bacterium]
MPEQLVTLARFFDPMAAQLVKNRLETEGVRVFLTGDAGGGTFPGLGAAFNSVYVQVFEEDLPKAQAILAASEEALEGDEAADASTAVMDREAIRGSTAAPDDGCESEEIQTAPRTAKLPPAETEITRVPAVPEPQPASTSTGERDVPALHWRSDDVVTRAWRAAVIGVMLLSLGYTLWGGLLLVGIPIQLYSLWLLARLAFMTEDLGSRGSWQLYGALLGNLAGFFLILGLCAYGRYAYYFSTYYD